MKKLLYVAFLAIVMAILVNSREEPEPQVLDLWQDHIQMSSSIGVSYLEEELDSPVYYVSSFTSSHSFEPIEPTIQAKSVRRKIGKPPSLPSSSSSIASSKSSVSSSRSSYCTTDDYLKMYADDGQKERARAARNKLCRIK